MQDHSSPESKPFHKLAAHNLTAHKETQQVGPWKLVTRPIHELTIWISEGLTHTRAPKPSVCFALAANGGVGRDARGASRQHGGQVPGAQEEAAG